MFLAVFGSYKLINPGDRRGCKTSPLSQPDQSNQQHGWNGETGDEMQNTAPEYFKYAN